jgi:hypothetical protein
VKNVNICTIFFMPEDPNLISPQPPLHKNILNNNNDPNNYSIKVAAGNILQSPSGINTNSTNLDSHSVQAVTPPVPTPTATNALLGKIKTANSTFKKALTACTNATAGATDDKDQATITAWQALAGQIVVL